MTTTLNASTAGVGGFIASSDNSGVLALQTSGTTAVSIDTSQRVGIGATPSATLQVFCQDSVSGKAIRAAYDGTYYSDYTESTLNCYNNNYTINVKQANNYIVKTSDTERMRIDSSGRVCIGVNSAAYSTACAMNVNVDTVSSGGGAWVSKAASTSTAFHMNFQNGNGGVGGISTSGSATQYVTSSDYRLKENITPMTGALAKVAQLKPVTYKWKVDGSDGEGFIAHELAEVKPDCVSGDKDAVDADGNPKYQGIDVSFLVATLTAAIQEQQALITAQAETINALTARIVTLEAV